MSYSLVENKLGYFEVQPKPDAQQLSDYYNQKYFVNPQTQYQTSYTADEFRHKYIRCREAEHFKPEIKTVLDIGCGEGFTLDYFFKKNCTVQGFDYTLDGVNHFFPHLKPYVQGGNLFEQIGLWAEQNHKSDLLICENVLEHVIDPVELLKSIKKLMAPGSACRLVVPNDFSLLQNYLVSSGLAPKDYWLAYPDHLNYFNRTSFENLLKSLNFQIIEMLADFPIDLFLMNPDTDFKQNPDKGKNCHLTRVAFENMLADQSIEHLISFRKGCAQSHIGRNLIAYCRV